MTEKKNNEPELIEDEDLDETSGGALPTALKIHKDPITQKVEIGALKAGASE